MLFLVGSMQGGVAERFVAGLCNLWVDEGHEVTPTLAFPGSAECLCPLDNQVRVECLAD